MQEENKKIELDILRHVEALTEKLNSAMASQSKSVFRRYPLTFTLLALCGAVAVGEGVKGLLEEIGFAGHPWYLLLAGLVILTFTGTLYKKLDK